MYAALHNRSAYSFGTALTMPDLLVARAAATGLPAVGLADRNGMYAAIGFDQSCRKAGIKPIHGLDLGLDRLETPAVSIVLLARDLAGFGNLCRLASLRQLKPEAPIRPDLLEAHAQGLFCLFSGLPKSTAARTRGVAGRRGPTTWPGDDAAMIEQLRRIFGGYLSVELAIHEPADAARCRTLARLADAAGVPVVAGSQSRCLDRDDAAALRAFASIGSLTLLDQPHPDKPTGTWHLRSPAEMAKLFARRPDALANSLAIAEQCNVNLETDRNRFPAFESPDGRTAMQHLRERCVAGCRWRYVDSLPQRGMGGRRPSLDEALARLDRELAVIEQVHYAEYFLVFDDIVRYCRSQGIDSLARGSAADSLVCYALGVSHACPFRFDLPFDRFLNPERAKFSKLADIDLDLPWDRRDQVIRWVYERWGKDRAAMIGAPNTYHARAAVAELGKVYGLPAHEVHKATKLLPWTAAWNVERAIRSSPEARDFPLAEEPYRTICTTAARLEGLPHHWAMHPCGMVVSPESLTDLVPVQPSPKGHLVAQYDMDSIEHLGFIKIDLLGQAGLSVLRDSLGEIARTERQHIDLARDVDYADPTTWHMIATGGARGVHHIESPAMISLLRQCNCRDIDCLTAVVAVIRPGAANQGKKDAFARRHQGLEPPFYAHESLEPVLAGTHGLMVFEEHILQIAVDFAGMNIGRADVLRRALNKENARLIAEMKAEFHTAARAHGRSQVEIDAVWPLVEGFRGFMFNKAHSAEYAVEAFQGAWLKYRWPAHYLAAILSNYRGFYANSPTLPQIMYVLDALRLGIGLLPPCVNRGGERFMVESICDDAGTHRPMIRIPVSHIHGLPAEFIEHYHAQRQRGPFADLADFVRRCRPGQSEAQALLDSGAFDGFGRSRPEMFWQLHRRAKSKDAEHLWDIKSDQHRRDKPTGSLTRATGSSASAASSTASAAGSFASAAGAPTGGLSGERAPCPPRVEKKGGRDDRPPEEQGASVFSAGGRTSCPPVFSGGRTSCPPVFSRVRASCPPSVCQSTTQNPKSKMASPMALPPLALSCPDADQIARREMELLGFPVTVHPLHLLGRDDQGRPVDWSRYLPLAQAGQYAGKRVTVCGMMVADRVNLTTTGDLMKFVTLADHTGVVETYLFPQAYRRFGHLTAAHPILEATGIVEPFPNGNGFNLRVERVAVPKTRRE